MPFGFADWESLGNMSQRAFNKLNIDSLTKEPEYPMLGQFNQHVASMPTPEQYKPSKLRRIAAAVGGFSTGYHKGAGAGFDTAQKMVRAPYENAVNDWQLKGQGLAQAANAEAASGRIESARNSALMKYYNDQEKNDITRERDGMTNRYNQGRLNQQQQKTDFLNAQLKQKGLEQNFTALPVTADGKVKLYDKNSGNVVDVGEEGEFFGPAQVADAAWERAKLASNTRYGVASMNNQNRITTTGMNNENRLQVTGAQQEGANYRTDVGATAPPKTYVTEDRKLQEFANQPENNIYVGTYIRQATDAYGQPKSSMAIDFSRQNEPGFKEMMGKFNAFKKPRVMAPRPRPTTSTPTLGSKYRKVVQ